MHVWRCESGTCVPLSYLRSKESQCNPSKTNTIGKMKYVLYTEVSLFKGFLNFEIISFNLMHATRPSGGARWVMVPCEPRGGATHTREHLFCTGKLFCRVINEKYMLIELFSYV